MSLSYISTLTWFIRYIYYLNFQFLNHVILMTNVGGELLNVWFEEENSSFYISGIVDYYCLNIISMQY